MQSRALAAMIIDDVMQNRTALTTALELRLSSVSAQDRAFIQDICFGVFRWLYRLEHYLGQLLEKPLKAKDSRVHALLLAGLYQLAYQRTPQHAAVSATVEACRELKKPWAKKLVNALLRRFLRDKLAEQTPDDIAIELAHPHWMVEQFKNDWPEHWQQILTANQAQAPLTLRVNQQMLSRDAYLTKLKQHALDASPTGFSQYGITLARATDIKTLPGFAAGEFSVQDQAAQFAAGLLDLKPGLRVLDACAAPGGKTAHCLELQPGLAALLAIDNQSKRLQRLAENLKRLRLEAELRAIDVCQTNRWWDGQPFERILLDAPCTASGVIRRHPDIKYLRTPAELERVRKLQQAMLQALWPLLRPGGRLLYATCSVFKCENDAQIAEFLQRHTAADIYRIDADWGLATEYGRQLLPGQGAMDGFYYCCIIKP